MLFTLRFALFVLILIFTDNITLRCCFIHLKKLCKASHNVFNWLKQHLKIKKFWGESENAVRIQIYTAITAYCMMAIVQKKMGIDRPIYEMLQIVSVSLTERTPLEKLFGKPNYNIVNELDGSTEPTLFDC